MRYFVFLQLFLFSLTIPVFAQNVSKEQRMIDSLQNIIKQKIELEKESNKIITEPIISINKDSSQIKVEFTPEQLKKFEQEAIKMLDDLLYQINIIAYKKNLEEKKNDAISTAMNLFINEESVVEIRSINNPSNPVYLRKIRNYLNRLKLLSYSDIKFSAFEVGWSKELVEGTDGNYYGVVRFCQKFEFDKLVTSVEKTEVKRSVDITCKTIQIVVKRADGFEGDFWWRVYFNDISVDDYKY
jgi:hypothetical protein